MNDPRLRRHELGFWQVAEPPTPDELRAYYATKYYQEERALYRKSYPADEISYLNLKIGQHARHALSLIGKDRPGRYLDVGCGEGFAMAWFQQHDWAVAGIDYSSAGLEQMHPHLLSSVETGDVFDLLSTRIDRGERFDVVWLKHVLEHVIDPVTLLRSLRQLVADDGVLVVTVPNDGSRYQERLFELGAIEERFWIAIPDHLSYFDSAGLRGIAGGTRWSVADILADFPIDLFLLHPGSNYVNDRSRGPDAHRARIELELLLGHSPETAVNDYFRAMAEVGIGRNLTAFLTPS